VRSSQCLLAPGFFRRARCHQRRSDPGRTYPRIPLGTLLAAVFGGVLAIVGPLFIKLCRKVFSAVPAPSSLFEHHMQFRIEILISFGVACMLVSAAGGHWSYQNYVYLRYLVCLIGAYLAVRTHEFRSGAWACVMAGIAVLFNPIVPLRLARSQWQLLDLATAPTLAFWAWKFRYPRPDEREFLEPFATPDEERPSAQR
jgi:membrane-associated HD superfamily phosphohydrolase